LFSAGKFASTLTLLVSHGLQESFGLFTLHLRRVLRVFAFGLFLGLIVF